MSKFFRCDDCGREVNGITSVNGMNFCAKCYQETFGNTPDATKLQEIWHEQFEKGWCPSEYVNELKQQLAEKDEKIKELEKQLRGACEKYHSKCEYLHKQDKQHRIEELNAILDNYYMFENGDGETIVEPISDISLINYLYERIKALKGEEKC